MLNGYKTIAVVLLLVVAGLEIDLTKVRRSGRAVLITSMLGALIPFALGYGSGLMLPDHYLADPSRRGLHAAFFGIALAISALPVITRTLMDLGLMKSEIGMLVLSLGGGRRHHGVDLFQRAGARVRRAGRHRRAARRRSRWCSSSASWR